MPLRHACSYILGCRTGLDFKVSLSPRASPRQSARNCSLTRRREGVMIRSILLTAAIVMGTSAGVHAQETPVTLDTKTGALHGTLVVPSNASTPMPVALIIAGSGPTDRDGITPLLPGK